MITSNRMIEFLLNGQVFAIELRMVKEVISVQKLTPIPKTPNYFLGIMNLRGSIVSVLDLRMKMGIVPKKHAENAVIILNINDKLIGLIVDEVCRVFDVKDENLVEEQIVNVDKNLIEFTYKNEENIVLKLNVGKLFEQDSKVA